MTDGNLTWVKSSYSGSQGGNCVEAAADGAGRILVRDTKDRGGSVLEFRTSQWRKFAASLKPEASRRLTDRDKSRKADISLGNHIIHPNLRGASRLGPTEISFSGPARRLLVVLIVDRRGGE